MNFVKLSELNALSSEIHLEYPKSLSARNRKYPNIDFPSPNFPTVPGSRPTQAFQADVIEI